MNLAISNKIALPWSHMGRACSRRRILGPIKSVSTTSSVSDAESRRDYREIAVPIQRGDDPLHLGPSFSMTDDWQNAKDGTPLVKIIENQAAIPGIKGDEGTQACRAARVSDHRRMDKLAERLKKYYDRGARFANMAASESISAAALADGTFRP